MVVTYPLLHLL
jgi:hypothetical protein